MSKFATGTKAAEEKASSGGFAGRAKYLSGETATKKNPLFFRVYTEKDEWPVVDQHQGIPTRPAPDGFKGNWPQKMGAICANDSAFRAKNEDGSLVEPPVWDEPVDHYGNCYIHRTMATVNDQWGRPLSRAASTVFAFVVLREPVSVGGEIKGFRDKMEEFEDRDGNKHQVPAVRLAAQKWSNFFGAVNAASFISGTVRKTDFMFTKSGTDLEVTPLGETPGHEPGSESWKVYDDAVALMKLDLGAILAEQSSPEYYARFFDDSKPRPAAKDKGSEEGQGGGTPPDDTAPQAEVAQPDIDAFRARMESARGAAAAQA